jgi:hypothetical protein
VKAPGFHVDAGDYDPRIRGLQEALFCRSTSGILDEDTQARLRGWQLVHGLEATGVIDEDTAEELGW